jgi:hypothetical protein
MGNDVETLCNNISCWEDRTELDVDGINKLVNRHNSNNDVLRFTNILRLCFKLTKVMSTQINLDKTTPDFTPYISYELLAIIPRVSDRENEC